MTTCQGCDEPVVVWWHGPWCSRHADEEFGRVPMEIAKLEEASRLRREGQGTTSGPVLEGPAELGGNLEPLPVADSAAPLSEVQFFAFLERDYWQDADV